MRGEHERPAIAETVARSLPARESTGARGAWPNCDLDAFKEPITIVVVPSMALRPSEAPV